ncbi:MAG: DUF4105 domain-containing protein [Deltaproteobacteria bacterium]|nr:DUF4105 domain-containing protein [Deltaproteobacteria bacterium]
MRALVAFALLLIAPAIARARPVAPNYEDEPPFIDVMTIGVGAVVFEKFGHAAICLRYHDPKRDPVCFNFGVTDFHEGAPMIWSFLRGQQEFWVEPLTYAGMMAFYRAEDRDIFVQTLPLTREQARGIETTLWAVLDGAGSRYDYDHFSENCTTRIRDVIDRATGGKLAVGADAEYPLTFRQLGERGLASIPPLIALSDFVFGRPLEDHPTVWQAMFHPEILRAVIEQRLGVVPRHVYQRKGPPFATSGATGRFHLLAIALLFALPILVARSRRTLRLGVCAAYAGVLAYVLLTILPPLWNAVGALALIVPLVFAAGLAGALHPRRGERLAVTWATIHLVWWGVFVWGLLILSPIHTLQWNEAALAVMPTDIVLPFLGPSKRRIYARGRVVILLLASLLCAIGVLRQPLWVPILVAFLPLSILAFDLPPKRD